MSQNTTPLDNETAKLIRAAEAGNAKAQARLGWYYDEGEGVEVDHEKAVYWYTKAAEQNHATAQYNLGCCYEVGTGMEIDMKKAVYWYEKAAAQNIAEALHTLGVFYDEGKVFRSMLTRRLSITVKRLNWATTPQLLISVIVTNTVLESKVIRSGR